MEQLPELADWEKPDRLPFQTFNEEIDRHRYAYEYGYQKPKAPLGTTAMVILKETYPALYAEALQTVGINANGANRITNFMAWVKEHWGEGPEVALPRKRQIKTMTWKAARTLYATDSGWRIVRLVDHDDLIQWGNAMGHCGSSHQAWVDRNLRFFLTLLDPKGVCHGSIDLRPVEWLKKPWSGSVYCSSMSYDNQRQYAEKYFPHPVDVEGHTCYIIGADQGYSAQRVPYDFDAATRPMYGGGKYAPVINLWYNANVVTRPGEKFSTKAKAPAVLHPVAGAGTHVGRPAPSKIVVTVAFYDDNGRARDAKGRFMAAPRAN